MSWAAEEAADHLSKIRVRQNMADYIAQLTADDGSRPRQKLKQLGARLVKLQAEGDPDPLLSMLKSACLKRRDPSSGMEAPPDMELALNIGLAATFVVNCVEQGLGDVIEAGADVDPESLERLGRILTEGVKVVDGAKRAKERRKQSR